MKLEAGLLYSEEHEWVRVEGEEAVIGITDFAQEQLSDVVYVELPEVGDSFVRGDIVAAVESVKAAKSLRSTRRLRIRLKSSMRIPTAKPGLSAFS
jgi:glycine cleavage system H protein